MARLAKQRPLSHALNFATVAVPFCLAGVAVAAAIGGANAAISAALAAVFCLLGGVGGALCRSAAADSSRAIPQMYLAIGIRAGVPLLLGALAHEMSPRAAEAGLLYYVAGYYLLLLTLDTLLSVHGLRDTTIAARRESPASG